MPSRPSTHKPHAHAAKAHKPKEQAGVESDKWREWYTHSRWRTIRAAHLKSEPLCRFCKSLGVVTEASIVDHVEPHEGDRDKFFAGPFQSLCKDHHDSTKKRMENAARRQRQKEIE